MENITDIKLEPIYESRFISPTRMFYKQDGVSKTWDIMAARSGVAIIIHNITRNVLVFVKQFRPAVYINQVEPSVKDGVKVVDTSAYPGSLGVTHELCAGLVDKDKPLVEIAREEVLEECGYKVEACNMEKVSSFQNGVGLMGSKLTLFYVEVTDEMRVSAGGGLAEEGEFIEVAELPTKDCVTFAMNDNILKPAGMTMALLWFSQFKLKQK